MTDFANEAAAIAAGWKKLQIDRGVGRPPRYRTEFHRTITGDPDGGSGTNINIPGESDVSAAAADTNALAALQNFRRLRYGQDAAVSKGKTNTNAHTVDVT